MSNSDVAALSTKQIILPDVSRGFKYARWKSQQPIVALKQKGLTVSKLQKELKLIHNVSSAAYKNRETICSSFSFQFIANFSLGLSFASFIIFITALIICGLRREFINYLDEYDMVSKLIINRITIKNVLITCAICSIITVFFGLIGFYIVKKSQQNCFNQYIESILSVHEYVKCTLLHKYEKQGIKWKLFVHYKDKKKRLNIFDKKHDITYYGIMIIIQVDENNCIENDENHYNIDDTSDTTNDEYATTSDDDNGSEHTRIQIKSSSNLQSDIEFDPVISHSNMANDDDTVPFIGSRIKLTN